MPNEINAIRTSDLILPLLSILAAATLTTLFFPGMMSYDSLYQYRQVIGSVPITNDHPPVMVQLWRLAHTAIPSPGALLLIHQVVYWAAAALFAWGVVATPLWRIFIFLLVGCWPPLLIHSVHLWKDTGMMIAMMACVSLLIADTRKPRTIFLVFSLCSLFYAIAVRHNAITGAIPLAAAVAWRISARMKLSRPSAGVAVIAAGAILITGLGVAFSRAFETKFERPGISLWIGVFDLSAVSLARSENLFPATISSVQGPGFMSELKEAFRPETNNYLYKAIKIPKDREADITGAWISLMTTHTGDYLKHRAYVFGRLLGAHRGNLFYPFHHGIDKNDIGLEFRFLDRVFPSWQIWFDRASRSLIYRPWPYLILAMAGFAVSCFWIFRNAFNPARAFILILTSSGLLMTLPLFVFTPAADYRYVLWLVCSSFLATILFVIDVLRGRYAATKAEGCGRL